MIFTGVGSRKTPTNVLDKMYAIGVHLAKLGWVLRSGSAVGADLAFERGCDQEGGKKEIYLPWKMFNNSTSLLYEIPNKAFDIASKIHPAWNKCTYYAQKLHARNVLQVLGSSLDKPSNLLICFTPNGKDAGGTATAMRLARMYSIKIINLASEDFDFTQHL